MNKSIVISKLDAVKRQLETAIHLYFLSRDPVAIHTLASAAHKVITDLNKHKGGTPTLVEHMLSDYIKPDRVKEVRKLLYKAENFFKHADKDPEETIEFNPDASEIVLWESCIKYTELTGEQTPTLQAMNGWFLLSHPDMFNFEGWQRERISSSAPFAKSLGKENFYKEFMQLRLGE